VVGEAHAPWPGLSGILIGKLKQIKTKTRRKIKEIWDFLPSFFTVNCDFAAFF